MSFIRAPKVVADTLSQLASRKQAIVFDDIALAMDPLWLDGVEPGTLGGQKEGQDAHAFARLLDQAVVFTNPGANHLAVMPGGIIPDQKPVALALDREPLTTPVQKLEGDATFWTASDKAQPHLVAQGFVHRSLLPEHSITSKGFGIRIAFLPHLLDQPHRPVLALPGVKARQGEARPPHLINKSGGPVRAGARIGDQTITSRFFLGPHCLLVQFLLQGSEILHRGLSETILLATSFVATVDLGPQCSPVSEAMRLKIWSIEVVTLAGN